MDAVRGLRQAAVMLAASAVVAFAVAVLVLVVWRGDFRSTLALTCMVIAALLALTGSNILSRAGSAEQRVMMGVAPEDEEPYSGASLGPLGVFLFVSVPLFVAGGLLYGAG